jgi:ABC-2 type transport system ATP-binding protein
MSNAIETRDVLYRAGKSFEIRDLTLNIPAGSIYGFLGPNGAGKTTTMRLVMAMLRPRRGAITVLGHSMPGEAPRAFLGTAYVPETPHLYPSLTVDETMRYHAAFFPRWEPSRANDLFARFDLDGSRRVGRLSKGERGQLMVTLALSQSPDLLVLDEPTDGLDPVVRRAILMALLDYVSQHGATVFISSHLVHELERICDWVGVMDEGQMVAELPMQTFKSGIKRLHVMDAPALIEDPPFVLMSREPGEGIAEMEVWVVRGWQAPMNQYFEGIGAGLREVVDLDLEESFVELLRTARVAPA